MIMTSEAEASVVEAAVVSGTDDFLVKPVTLPVLKEKLTKLFSDR